jgi:hypothetical protein
MNYQHEMNNPIVLPSFSTLIQNIDNSGFDDDNSQFPLSMIITNHFNGLHPHYPHHQNIQDDDSILDSISSKGYTCVECNKTFARKGKRSHNHHHHHHIHY